MCVCNSSETKKILGQLLQVPLELTDLLRTKGNISFRRNKNHQQKICHNQYLPMYNTIIRPRQIPTVKNKVE